MPTADDAVPDETAGPAALRDASVVALGEGCGEPRTLSDAIAAEARRRAALTGTAPFTVYAGVVLEAPPWLDDLRDGRLRCRTPMPGRGIASAGDAVARLPIGYADIGPSWRRGDLRADAVALSVTPQATLGVQWGYATEMLQAVRDCSGAVLVEMNGALPHVHGAPEVDLTDAVVVHSDRPPVEMRVRPPTDVDRAVARHVATLVDDGACLSIGIGALGDAVLGALADAGRRRLSFHAGMLGDGIVDVADSGMLGDATPLGDPPLTTSILLGSHRLLHWASTDARVEIVPSSRLHPAAVTSGIDGFCAVNFALQVDLVGNVGAETIGGRVVSGPGGALDFAVGACAAPDGRSIVALPSTTANGASTIVPVLDGQTTTPATRVHFVVTEHGVAELAGRSADERAAALIAVAAPQHRDTLRRSLG